MRKHQTIPEQVVAALKDNLGDRLLTVVLFGSRVRGEAKDESDWDFLVIADNLPENTWERHLFLKKLLPRPCRGAVSLLARTPAEFDAGISSLYLDIALDGQIIYDPQDFGAQRFSFLRDLIRRKGLYRQRTPAGDLWRFRTLHTWGWELTWD